MTSFTGSRDPVQRWGARRVSSDGTRPEQCRCASDGPRFPIASVFLLLALVSRVLTTKGGLAYCWNCGQGWYVVPVVDGVAPCSYCGADLQSDGRGQARVPVKWFRRWRYNRRQRNASRSAD